jgi:putative aldouronate transport system substrate-binding protein
VFKGDSTRYINQYRTAREWYELGLLPEDATIMNDAVNLLKEKKIFAETQNARPGYLEICKNAYGYDFVGVPLLEKAVGTGNVQGTLTGVSITSENPARAVEFYNLLYSDKELYNTLVYGIENQDYAHTDADHVDRIQDQYVQSAWQVGNSFNAYLLTGQAADLVEQTIEFNSSAKMGKMLGFSPDVTAIQAEVAAVQGIAQEYDTILINGLSADVDGTLAEYRDKVFASGGQAIIDELQKQADAYLAGQ